MRRKSEDRQTVRKDAGDIRPSSPADLAKLAAIKDGDIDTSEIPERAGPTTRVVRDAKGQVVKASRSRLRSAIQSELQRRGISGHQLWLEAMKHCRTIPESAVYEFLAGKRQVGLAYLDAMLEALDLTVGRR